MTPPRSKVQQLEGLADDAALAEVDRIDALSADEVSAELATYGVVSPSGADDAAPVSGPSLANPREGTSPVEDAASHEPRVAEAHDAAPSPLLAPRAPSGPPRFDLVAFLWAVIAAVAIADVAVAYLHLGEKPDSVHPSPPLPSPSPPVPSAIPRKEPPMLIAEDFRVRAKTSCDEGAWEACLVSLDHAAAIDPAGDASPAAKELRERAIRGMRDRKR